MDDVPVLGIEEIVLEGKDLDRSVAFYEDVIGLPLYSHGPQQTWFRVGEEWLALSRLIAPAAGSTSPFSSHRKTQSGHGAR